MKYTREIAEEVLNDFNEYTDVIIPLLKIEEFLDHKFKPQLPKTGWVKGAGSAIIYRTGATSGHGINHGKWETCDSWSFMSFPETWQPATREEIEEALINFARKRGYKNGNYECLTKRGYNHKVNDDSLFMSRNGNVWHGDRVHFYNLLFRASTGEWAKIIEDENRELKEQIEKVEKQLNELRARL